MDDFSFSNAVQRREKENSTRRDQQRKQLQVAAEKQLAAQLKTEALLSQRENIKREAAIQTQLAELREKGAPDLGVRLEMELAVVVDDRLPIDSDKVILPQKILAELSTNALVAYPLMFELYSSASGRRSHCGVLEFSDVLEGEIRVPKKVARSLKISDTSKPQIVRLRYKHLPRCTFVQFRISEEAIVLFPDFRSFLESALSKSYITVSEGDVLTFAYGGIEVLVVKAEPDGACCLVDTDVTTDLVVAGSSAAESSSKWTIGQAVVFTEQAGGQKRLYLTPSAVNQSRLLEISTDSEDACIYVSIPPSLEAKDGSFDFFSIPPLKKVSIGLTDLTPWGFTDWPSFVTVATDYTGSAPSAGITVNAQLVDPIVEKASSADSVSVCSNCGQSGIPSSSLPLHKLHCEARYFCCGVCKKVVPKSTSHSQCSDCGRCLEDQHSHTALWHTSVTCLCGKSVVRGDLVAHRTGGSCAYARRSVCRFCRLSVVEGDLSAMDVRDKLMGFASVHEAQCGNRTTGCDVCGKLEKLKDMHWHMQAFHGSIKDP